MPLSRTVTLFLGATALVVAPSLSPDVPHLSFQVDKAFAKNGNGNGNGGGNGNGNSGGNGNGGGNKGNSGEKGNSGNSNRGGNSASNGNGNKGFGIFNRGNGSKQAKSNNGNGNEKGLGGFLNSVFGTENSKTSGKRQTASRGKSGTASHRLPKAERATLASIAVTPQANPTGKPKNFNARLGRLNSLNRNYHAYLNSNDPHLAAIQAYINDSLAYERLSADLQGLEQDLLTARTLFDSLLQDVDSYDGFAYDSLTSQQLEDRLAELESVDTTELTEVELTALETERQALENALQSDAYSDFKTAEAEYETEKTSLDGLAADVSDEALEEALLAMANENRVREYGDEYVDEEMLDWAKQVLGVGAYVGKIDEIREATETPEDGADPLDPDETAGAGDGSDGSDANPNELRLISTSN
ncbi:hypothetical protein V1T76_10200 [Roseibium sp. FZY0029]|uniref:hypothetical protein n=1 Tax=Roseibium sp. FZY0029 TaxID=3116647 RepID=UPI002EC819F9|nr:hypothetical protein [Roseibium sp. FZY0029]